MEASIFSVTLGYRIRFMRKYQQISIETMAERMLMEIKTIEAIEKGEIEVSVHLLFQLAEAMDLRPSEMLEDLVGSKKPTSNN